MRNIKLYFQKKWVRRTIFLGVLALTIWFLRFQILKAIGDYLIVEDTSPSFEVLFVLGGNSLERGLGAAAYYQNGTCTELVCTGGNIPSVLAALDTSLYEAEITRNVLLSQGVDSSHVQVLTASTSTWEEAAEILQYAKAHHLSRIGIISSKHHLRRVKNVFSAAADNSSIQISYVGAKSLTYEESEWWKSEEGLIMVNNEYMKLLYYLFKY